MLKILQTFQKMGADASVTVQSANTATPTSNITGSVSVPSDVNDGKFHGAGRMKALHNIGTVRPSPVEPPEPDLSHLTVEEREQIAAVLERAKHLHDEEEAKVRELEEDYSSFAASIVERESLTSNEDDQGVCPICQVTVLDQKDADDILRVCSDCERWLCVNCGSVDPSLSTKGGKEWMCSMCQKRRRLVMSTGLWYHGSRNEMPQIQRLSKNLGYVKKTDKTNKPNRLERTSSLSYYENYKECESKQTDSRRGNLYRQGSLPPSFDDEIIDNEALDSIRESFTNLYNSHQFQFTDDGDITTRRGLSSRRFDSDEFEVDVDDPESSRIPGRSDDGQLNRPDSLTIHSPYSDELVSDGIDDHYYGMNEQQVVMDDYNNYDDEQYEEYHTYHREQRGYDGYDDEFDDEVQVQESFDVASYAASVAKDTHLLSEIQTSITDETDHYSYVQDQQHMEQQDTATDHANSKRQQKLKPPPESWSPVTDLSPILEETSMEDMFVVHNEAGGPSQPIELGNRESAFLKRYSNFSSIEQLHEALNDNESVAAEEQKQEGIEDEYLQPQTATDVADRDNAILSFIQTVSEDDEYMLDDSHDLAGFEKIKAVIAESVETNLFKQDLSLDVPISLPTSNAKDESHAIVDTAFSLPEASPNDSKKNIPNGEFGLETLSSSNPTINIQAVDGGTSKKPLVAPKPLSLIALSRELKARTHPLLEGDDTHLHTRSCPLTPDFARKKISPDFEPRPVSPYDTEREDVYWIGSPSFSSEGSSPRHPLSPQKEDSCEIHSSRIDNELMEVTDKLNEMTKQETLATSSEEKQVADTAFNGHSESEKDIGEDPYIDIPFIDDQNSELDVGMNCFKGKAAKHNHEHTECSPLVPKKDAANTTMAKVSLRPNGTKQAPVVRGSGTGSHLDMATRSTKDRETAFTHEAEEGDKTACVSHQTPTSITSLKTQLREELKSAVAMRKKYTHEMEEIRALEKQLDIVRIQEQDQRKQMERKLEDIRKYNSSREAAMKADPVRPVPAKRPAASQLVLPREELLKELPKKAPPQPSPRKTRPKKTQPDPGVYKFSPITENEVEDDFLERLKTETLQALRTPDQQYPSNVSTITTPTPARTESVDTLSRRAGNKLQIPIAEIPISSSSSNIPYNISPQKASFDDYGYREEKKQYLQVEIEQRRKQLLENERLKQELRRLAVEGYDPRLTSKDQLLSITQYGRTKSREASPIRTSSREASPMRSTARESSPIRSNIPVGIIKPLDISMLEDLLSDAESVSKGKISQQKSRPRDLLHNSDNYSSGEYIVHKTRSSVEDVPSSYAKTALRSPSRQYTKSCDFIRSRTSNDSTSKDSGLSSSLTDPYGPPRPNMDIMGHTDYSDMSPIPTDDDTVGTISPPPMPILENVTRRNRRILNDIGSRPLSEEFSSIVTEDNMPITIDTRGDHKEDSDEDDLDEPIMENLTEGGITILKQRHRKPQPPPVETRHYPFPVKRILLTRDFKDKGVSSNGIGVKIVGGKEIPGSEDELGAFVSTLYPGGIADQLHGELREGDRVLEWNGIPLTGKTYEEAQTIINQPSGEIEMVIKSSLYPSKYRTIQASVQSPIRDGSQSSYDNLEYVSASEFEDIPSDAQDDMHQESLDAGIDAEMLATHLESMSRYNRRSPLVMTPASSNNDVYVTPNMSTPSPLSDKSRSITSGSRKKLVQNDKGKDDDVCLGEIQIQIGHDEYDNSLTVSVIQARNLPAKDANGFSDPFVKLCLFPGRGSDNRRRTEVMKKTLHPEWHQSFVYMKIAKKELKRRSLELTVWDYDIFGSNDFMGQVLLKLSDKSCWDNRPHWYKLYEHDGKSELPRQDTIDLETAEKANKNRKSRDAKKGKTSKADKKSKRSASAGPILEEKSQQQYRCLFCCTCGN